MKTLAEFTKTTLIGGILIILPIYVAILLLLKALSGLLAAVKPIAAGIPAAVEFKQLLAILVLVAICFITGLIVRTGPGLRAKNAFDRSGSAGDYKCATVHAGSSSPFNVHFSRSVEESASVERFACFDWPGCRTSPSRKKRLSMAVVKSIDSGAPRR
jgi:uncharacterized protein (DUF58 family)